MKSFFTNLGKALLCGAVVAMIGCTDLHSDIKLVETNNQEAVQELQKALDALEAKLDANYATKQALAEAQEALQNKDADLQTAIDAINASLANYATNESVNAVLARVAELEGALGAAQEEVAANLAALEAALATAQDEIYMQMNTITESLSSVIALLEDEAAARAAEDELIWNSFNTLQETLSALNTLLEDEAAAREGEDEQIYQQLNTLTETVSSVAVQLAELAEQHDQDVEDLYAKFNVIEEFVSGLTNRVVDVEDALATHLAAFEAYKLSVEEAIALATEDMQEYLTQMLNLTNDQIAEIVSLQEALVGRIDTIEKTITNLINLNNDQYEEVLSLIIETKEELTLVVNNILNYLSDMQGQIDDLAARVQSLVFIPEYSDGKATIEWGLLIDNDSAVNFILKNIATRQNLVLFKDLVVDFLKEVKDIAVELGGPVVDYADKTIDQFISDLVNTEAMADALKIMLSGIEDIVAKEVAELYNEKFAGLGEEIAIPEGVPTVDELTKSIMSELYQSIDLSKLDIKKILKTVITKVTNKAFDLVSVDAIITELKKINIYDAIDMLTSAEFEGLLSDLLQVVKSFEEKALSNTALLKKESVIRYKVQAQNAAAVAKAIAANPSVLSYDVEAVDVRAAAPALEITKVVAKGDEIHVSVVPQNFHYRFYLTYVLEDSFIYGAAESFFDKYGKTGLISYSAALVLNDGNNIRSTEYVNFVSSENPEIFTPEVVRNGEVVEYETIQAVKGETETIELCKDMQMAYLSVPHRKILTKEGLAQKGFFGITEKVTVVTANGEAGPCEFNGRVGEMFDWFDYTFTTVWSVNDIELVVKSNLICK